MSCDDPRGFPISKGQVYRLACDLDGFPTTSRTGSSGETHYFVVLSHFGYNHRISKNSFLAVGLSSNNRWPYSEELIPMEHFDHWDSAVDRHGYYSRFFKAPEVYFQSDKVVRLCQKDIESINSAQPTLSLSTVGLNKVIERVSSFLKMSNDDPN